MATAAEDLTRTARKTGKRRAPGQGDQPLVRALSGRAAPMHVLMAELLAAGMLVGIRAVADYDVKTTGSLKGTVGHPKGQLGPLPILSALVVLFFLLSFLAVGASQGKARAKVAVAIGALVDIGLAMHSVKEIEKVANVFGGSFGKASTAPPAPTSLVTEAPVRAGAPSAPSSGKSSSPKPSAPAGPSVWTRIIHGNFYGI